MQTIADLQRKEVINIHDGTRLGFVYDIEFDIEKGVITALRIPGRSSGVMSLFGKTEDFVVPWESIKKIGDDIILVDAKSDVNIYK